MLRVGSGRIRRCSKCHGSGRVGSGQAIFKFHGSARGGSRGFQISRVGSGRFMRCFKCHGSGRIMTREIRVTRGSGHNDPRVVFDRPAGRTRGSGPLIRIFANLQLPAGGSLS